MYTITYNLRNAQSTSETFYEDLAVYSRDVYKELDELMYESLQPYFRFRIHEGNFKVYSYPEAYLELLTLGVLWNVYSGDAMATGERATDFLHKLADIRENNTRLKPLADAFRGICLTAMMAPDLYDNLCIAPPSLYYLKDLLDYLEATGEFKYEVGRLRHWERYFASLDEAKIRNVLEDIIAVGLWFEKDSIKGLGVYTENVDRYLNEIRPKRYWREDVIFCGRRRVEYHLNMVGSEWLNQAYLCDFRKTEKQLVLVPTCLRLLSEEQCKAEKSGEWLVCTKCNAQCQVNQLCKLEDELAFKLYMVPHNTSLKNALPELHETSVGVVGIACILNLISGGWMLAEKGIPAQCLLLDYCGCNDHWHHERMPTALNLERFRAILTNL